MTHITLTDYNDNEVLVPIDGIVVSEQPVGQTMITLPYGGFIQVKESVEEVNNKLRQAKDE